MMRSLFGGKIWVILLAVFALLGLFALASGLSGMEFDPPFVPEIERDIEPFSLTNSDGSATLWMRYLVAGMLIVMLLLALGPVRPQRQTSMFSLALRVIGVIAFFVIFFGRVAENGFFMNKADLPPMPGGGEVMEVTPFTEPSLSFGWVFWITVLIVVVSSVIVIHLLNRSMERWLAPKPGLEEIAEAARASLEDLSGGKVSRNAVIRCYTNMSTAVNQHRGITRGAAMTPAEFAGHLEGAGLPGDAVNGLTRVFEKVRYGGQTVDPQEIREAKRCLTSILRACEAK